jgi:iron(III) transport system ATP-binding protein
MRFEIRRLHDEFRYTTVYVTHDQLEAMTTADRIVVMNTGRIEQIGSPEDIFLRPQSEFVARFIGGTNILRGTVHPGTLQSGPLTLHWQLGEAGPGPQAAISIRPHEIELTASVAEGPNAFPGTVLRHTYIGAHRDYLIDLGADTQIRVVTALEQHFAPGTQIGVRLPPHRCRALPR